MKNNKTKNLKESYAKCNKVNVNYMLYNATYVTFCKRNKKETIARERG